MAQQQPGGEEGLPGKQSQAMSVIVAGELVAPISRVLISEPSGHPWQLNRNSSRRKGRGI